MKPPFKKKKEDTYSISVCVCVCVNAYLFLARNLIESTGDGGAQQLQ